ncbi:MAG TPA: trypsin-like serine protease [Symbiobacteriaceae bacterium]|jgi:secreted trypsin-like serine protease|nr:trypsin-like serine protease [Symbiobacteriaceae bacterium]
MRKSIVSMLAVLVAVLVAVPVLAITYGTFDGEGHPNVGAMIAERTPGVKRPLCSGTLIAPKVFLTASHCTTYLEGLGISDVWVTFDAKFNAETATLYHGRMVSHPEYRAQQNDPHDIAVILLDEAVTDRTPAPLPTLGLMDELNEQNGLKEQSFTAVGYGIQEPVPGQGGVTHDWPQERWVAVATFSALNDSWIRMQQNQQLTDGGTCNGDSGGPNFLGSSDLLVGITITGDMECFATNVAYRLDTQSARDFLSQFEGVVLP